MPSSIRLAPTPDLQQRFEVVSKGLQLPRLQDLQDYIWVGCMGGARVAVQCRSMLVSLHPFTRNNDLRL